MKKLTLVYSLVIMGVLLMGTSSCTKKGVDNLTLTGLVPMLTTSTTSNITQITASGGGDITSDGGSTVTARGVCWAIYQNPTTGSSKTTDGTGTGSFTSAMTGLTANTTYYVRAYATNATGTGYGENVSFTTQQGAGGTITDIDGNVYHFITIGTQVWLVENLKTTKYRNGDPIPDITDNTTWSNLTTGAYCNYNNDVNNAMTYGRLYNWAAVNDGRNIAPTGWHIPSDAEWTTLTSFLGSTGGSAGGKLKETGTVHWQSPNTGATNESGFTALPGGYRDMLGTFNNLYLNGYWWSATAISPTSAWYRNLFYLAPDMGSDYINKTDGYSVRCLKD
jgi:uncharacterized protein (TIGR02145 family)